MTASDIIDKLGGTTATARLFGVLPSAVSNWRADGKFPARLHYRLHLEAEQRGIEIPPVLLGADPVTEAA